MILEESQLLLEVRIGNIVILDKKSPTKNDATVKIDRSLLINLAKPTMPVTRCKEARELVIKNFAQT